MEAVTRMHELLIREYCTNHPDKEAVGKCHVCGLPYCKDCLVEGPEFYYCKNESCLAMKPESKGRLRSVGCSTFIVVFLLLSVIDSIPLLMLATKQEEKARIEAVGSNIPDMFPVLVTTPVKSSTLPDVAIVFNKDLADYLEAHPGSKFIVPISRVDELNSQLKRFTYDSGFGVGGFSVTKLPGGRQRFKVEGTWDDDRVNIGWYEADSSSFKPIKCVWYFGPGLVMKYTPVIFVFNLVVAFIIMIAWKIVINRQSRYSAQQSE
ncbi:MAG: hypothetical protein ABFD83_07080 [Armatimonadota bacterium]